MSDTNLLTTKKNWQEWAYPLGLLFLVLFLFGNFFSDDKMLVSLDQVKALGIRTPVHNTLIEEGTFAQWSPGVLGGMPAGDALAGDYMYPPSIILSALFPQYRVFGFAMIFHIFLAGFFFYMLLRRGFQMTPLISFIGGVFYMLNPEFFSHIFPGHDGKMFVIAWLPFMVWRVKVVLESPNFLNATLVALGVSMSLLTSHIQLTYFSMWGLIAYWMFHTGYTIYKEKSIKPILLTTGFFWVGILIGLAIGSLQLFPAYMYVQDQWSVRGIGKTPEAMWQHATSWCIHWPEFFSLWIAKFGNWFDYYWSENGLKLNSEYAGAMVVFGALLALVRKPKSWRIFWAVFATIMVAFALTKHTPLYKLFYNFAPGVKKMRAASMIMHWFSFSVVLLTALFLKDVQKEFWAKFSDKIKKRWQIGLIAGIVLTSIITVIFMQKDTAYGFAQNMAGSIGPDSEYQDKTAIFNLNYTKNFIPALQFWWFMISASLLTLLLVMKGIIKKEVFLIVVLFFGMIDLYTIDTEFINIKPNYPYKNPGTTISTLMNKQANVRNNEEKPFRVFFLEKPFAQAYRYTEQDTRMAKYEVDKDYAYRGTIKTLTSYADSLRNIIDSSTKTAKYNEQEVITAFSKKFFNNNPQVNMQISRIGFEDFIDQVGQMQKDQVRQMQGKSPMESCRNIAGTYGLEGMTGFHDNELKWYRQFRSVSPPHGDDNKLMKAIAGPDGRPSAEGMTKAGNRLRVSNCKYILYKDRGVYQYAINQYAMNRISFTNSYKVIEDEKKLDTELDNPLLDSRVTTLLPTKPSFESAPAFSADTSIDVKWKKYSNSYRAAEITVNSTGILRIAEVYYPGWEIKLNGKKVDREALIKRDVAWLGVEIDKGTYLLEMSPKSLYLGKVLGISLTLIILILLFWAYHTYLWFMRRKGDVSNDKTHRPGSPQNKGDVSNDKNSPLLTKETRK